jgi:hypothetical protein
MHDHEQKGSTIPRYSYLGENNPLLVKIPSARPATLSQKGMAQESCRKCIRIMVTYDDDIFPA